MLDKLLNNRNFPWAKKLNDPRSIGIAVFVVIALLVTWSGIKAVQSNYKLEKQISGLQQQNDVQKLANQNLKLQNEYYNSNQYLELTARQNFGLAAPGEKELIVPNNVALSYTKNLTSNNSAKQSVSQSPFFVKNVKAWWNFFLGHQDNSSDSAS